MSTLQLSLSIAGGLVLAVVVAHGAWTSRRSRPRQAEPQTERIEPGEAVVARPPEPVDSEVMQLPTVEKKPPLDALIDVIAPIALDAPVSGDAVLAAMPPTRRVGSKPFGVEGINERSREWEMPRPGQRYEALQAAVQLANRAGALNEIEYSEFVVKTQALADALGGTPEFPEMRDEVARARELDHFASTHDAQLSMTLRARDSAWSPGYVHQNAARLGFVPGVLPGRLVLPASVMGLPPVLVLSFDSQAALADDPAQSAIREATLSLDVAQVDREEQAFERMRDAALQLARTMDGVVTDDAGQPLNMQAMDQIAAELEKLYDILDSRELSAGSPQARRLFS